MYLLNAQTAYAVSNLLGSTQAVEVVAPGAASIHGRMNQRLAREAAVEHRLWWWETVNACTLPGEASHVIVSSSDSQQHEHQLGQNWLPRSNSNSSKRKRQRNANFWPTIWSGQCRPTVVPPSRLGKKTRTTDHYRCLYTHSLIDSLDEQTTFQICHHQKRHYPSATQKTAFSYSWSFFVSSLSHHYWLQLADNVV